MGEEKKMGQVISIDEKLIKDHLGELVRGTAEDTLNGMLDEEADKLCGAIYIIFSIQSKAMYNEMFLLHFNTRAGCKNHNWRNEGDLE